MERANPYDRRGRLKAFWEETIEFLKRHEISVTAELMMQIQEIEEGSTNLLDFIDDDAARKLQVGAPVHAAGNESEVAGVGAGARRHAHVVDAEPQLESDSPIGKPRAVGSILNADALRHTKPPTFGGTRTKSAMKEDDDVESFSTVSVVRSVSSNAGSNVKNAVYIHRSPNVAVLSVTNMRPMKTNPATANSGYDNKKALWGTAFTSLMVACMKKYMQHTGEATHTVDELFLMKTYNNIVPQLYQTVTFAELPALQSNESLLLSNLFKRRSSDDVPDSTASTWWKLSQNPDGASCVSVIERIFGAAKMVPEALMHPISQLVAQMPEPVVRKGPDGPTFSIPSSTKVLMSPTGFESLCKCLKNDSLKTYVNYRLEGDSKATAVTKMVKMMRDTEMFDSKNMHRGRELLINMSAIAG